MINVQLISGLARTQSSQAMVKTGFILLGLAMLLALQSCGRQGAGDVPQSDALAEVDGVAITVAMVDEFLELKGQTQVDADGRKAALKELIRLQAMTNRAEEQGLHNEPSVVAELALNRQRVLLNHFTQRFTEQRPVTEDELKQAYNTTVKRSGQQQVLLQSILYVDEQAAVSALLSVEEGTSFDELIAEAQAKNIPVENLNWLDLSQVPEDYAPVIADVETGQVVPVPLRDQYQGRPGWRVFRVMERRDFQPPAFNEVRPALEQQIRRQKLLDWSQRLLSQSEIEMADGSEFQWEPAETSQ